MRAICLGWEYLITHWSKNVKAFTPEDISLHIKMIVSNQRSCSIPTKPPLFFPAQEVLPQIDTLSLDIVAMDSARLEDSDEF